MSRPKVREAIRSLLRGLPVQPAVRAIKVPSIVVSTPSEATINNGFDIQLTVQSTVYAESEDEVDRLLGEVEKRFAEDETLGGTVRDLQFTTYELEVDEGLTYIGTQAWTAIPTGG